MDPLPAPTSLTGLGCNCGALSPLGILGAFATRYLCLHRGGHTIANATMRQWIYFLPEATRSDVGFERDGCVCHRLRGRCGKIDHFHDRACDVKRVAFHVSCRRSLGCLSRKGFLAVSQSGTVIRCNRGRGRDSICRTARVLSGAWCIHHLQMTSQAHSFLPSPDLFLRSTNSGCTRDLRYMLSCT